MMPLFLFSRTHPSSLLSACRAARRPSLTRDRYRCQQNSIIDSSSFFCCKQKWLLFGATFAILHRESAKLTHPTPTRSIEMINNVNLATNLASAGLYLCLGSLAWLEMDRQRSCTPYGSWDRTDLTATATTATTLLLPIP